MSSSDTQRARQLTVFPSGNATFDRWQRDVIGILNPMLRAFWSPGRVLTISRNTQISTADAVVAVDASGGARVVSLPLAADMKNCTVSVKKIDATANAVTIIPFAPAETIDGAVSQSITTQWFSYELACDGERWYIV